MRQAHHLDARAPRLSSSRDRRRNRSPLARYRAGAKEGGFESGIEMALRSILLSPNFLFRVESQPATVAPNTAYRLSDIDLASRLSFFIWSSIPDDTLLDLAAKGALHRPDVMQQQVRRMLADPKSQALVDNFAGQWLHVRNVQTHQPSPETLFHFDDNLRKALEQEMNLFFASIMRENRPITDLARRQLHVPERAPREALWHSAVCMGERFQRVTLAGRQRPRRAARQRRAPDVHVVSESDLAGHPRKVDSRERVRHAAAAAAAQRPRAGGGKRPEEGAADARADGRAPQESRSAPVATPRWISWGSPSRTSMRSASGDDIYPSGAQVDASGQLPDGAKFDGPVELRKAAARALGSVRNHGDGKAANLCAGPGSRSERHARSARDQARRRDRQLSVRVADPADRGEHSVYRENVGVIDVLIRLN